MDGLDTDAALSRGIPTPISDKRATREVSWMHLEAHYHIPEGLNQVITRARGDLLSQLPLTGYDSVPLSAVSNLYS